MQLDRSFAHSNLTFVLRDSLQAGAAFVKLLAAWQGAAAKQG
jgi:hypothetical protein